MVLKDRKIVKSKVTVFDCIKKIDIDLEQIFNFDIIAQNKIAKHYFKLLNDSILNMCFKDITKSIYKDFSNNFVLMQIKNMIKHTTKLLLIKRHQQTFGFSELLQLKVLIHVFLNQIRYDANIWLNLSKKESKSIQKRPILYWNLAILLLDFDVLADIGLKFEDEQKEIIRLLFTIKNSDSFNEIKAKLVLIKNNYLPLRIFALEKEILKTVKNKKMKNKRFEQILYATLFQMIAIFIRQNIRKRYAN